MRKISKIALVISLMAVFSMPVSSPASKEAPAAPGKSTKEPGQELFKDRLASAKDKAQRLYQQGKHYDALKAVGEALTLKPNDPEALYLNGIISLQLGLPARAVEGFTLCVRMDPGHRDARLKLADILVASGNLKSAKSHVEELATSYPDNLDVKILLSRYHLARKDVKEAQKFAQEALEIAPQSGEVLVNMANVHLAKEQVSDADALAEKAAKLKTLNADEMVALGRYFLKRGKFEEGQDQFEKAVDTYPENTIAYLTLGELKLLKGEFDETEKLYRQAVAIEPRAASPRMRLAEFLSGVGKTTEALGEVNTLLKYYPDNLEILSLKGRIYLRQGDNKAAAELFEKLGQRMPRSADIHYQRARALFGLGKIEEMKKAAKKALELDSGMYNARILLAGALLLEGKVDEAREQAMKVADEQPLNPFAQSILGDVALAKKDFNAAARRYQKVLEINPRDSKAHLSLGRVYALSGKVGEAEKEFRLALKHNPREYDALSHLVELLLSNERAADAEEYLKERLEQGEDPVVYHFLANTYRALERPEDVEKSLRKAIELKPNYTAAHVDLALFLNSRGRTAEAIQHLGALKSDGLGTPQTTATLAQLLMEDQQYKRAAALFEEYLEVRPQDPGAANNLVWIYTEYLRDFKKARRIAQNHLKNWTGPEIKDTLGWLSYKEGDFVNAEKLLAESASELNNNPRVIYHLAMTKYELGKVEEAKSLLKAALETDLDFPEADKAKRLLDRL